MGRCYTKNLFIEQFWQTIITVFVTAIFCIMCILIWPIVKPPDLGGVGLQVYTLSGLITALMYGFSKRRKIERRIC